MSDPMTATETCCCGASLTASSFWSNVAGQLERFREAHAACRNHFELSVALPDPRDPTIGTDA